MRQFVSAFQNGSTARDIASQQGYRAVAELLGEYERRLVGSDTNTTARTATPGPTDDASGSDTSSTGSGAKAGRLVRRPPAVYNRDVIPSPKNSPLKSCTPLDQYIRSNKPSHWRQLYLLSPRLWCNVSTWSRNEHLWLTDRFLNSLWYWYSEHANSALELSFLPKLDFLSLKSFAYKQQINSH